MAHPTTLAANIITVAEWLADNGYTNIFGIEAHQFADSDVKVHLETDDLYRVAELAGVTVGTSSLYALAGANFTVDGVKAYAYAAAPKPAPAASDDDGWEYKPGFGWVQRGGHVTTGATL